MRLLNILFAVIYLCLQLGEPTRSATQDWADHIERKTAHNSQFTLPSVVQLAEAESSGSKKDKSGDSPQFFAQLPTFRHQYNANLLLAKAQPATYYQSIAQLLASPRAPPSLV